MKKAYFAAGCFWCAVPAFRDLDGVISTVSGYSGGTEPSPAYEDVKAQRTGHRETVEVCYDERAISFERLLDAFFSAVDPFDGGGQFIDRGFSYTLAVYCNGEEEKRAVRAKIEEIQRESGRPVFVAVEDFTGFWRAEEYHQDYDLKNPDAFAEELKSSGRK